MCELLGDVSGLKRSVGFGAPEAELTCVTGIGSRLWERMFGLDKPADLHPFRRSPAPATRAARPPATCCSTSAHIGSTSASSWRGDCERLEAVASVVDEVHGFQLVRRARPARVRRRHREPRGRGSLRGGDDRRRGSGVRRRQLRDRPEVRPRPGQLERAADRGAGAGDRPHKARATSSFPTRSSPRTRTSRSTRSSTRTARSSRSCASTCRSGASARASSAPTSSATRAAPTVIEQMLTNMFIGKPPGNYDRILDFSRAVTGNLFFVPSPEFLDDPPARRRLGRALRAADEFARPDPTDIVTGRGGARGSLGIGSLSETGDADEPSASRTRADQRQAAGSSSTRRRASGSTPALAARKLVDFSGPLGWEHSATNLGRTSARRRLAGRGRLGAAAAACCRWSSCAPSSSSRARSCATPIAAPTTPTSSALDRAAHQIAMAENAAVLQRLARTRSPASPRSRRTRRQPLGDAPEQLPAARRRAPSSGYSDSGVGGPYGLALGREPVPARDRRPPSTAATR